MAFTPLDKSRARIAARKIRANAAFACPDAGVELIRHWPGAGQKRIGVVAGYIPIHSEIDPMPLMDALADTGHRLALPCIRRKAHPLVFRCFQRGDQLRTGAFGTKEPLHDAEMITPDIILPPLLAFSRSGFRLGYGGGYYDQTLAGLRNKGELFACGLAYAAQEVPHLPVDRHDQKLDGILTESGFRKFT